MGVLIDEKLNWKAHIKLVQSKLSKTLGIMYKAGNIVNTDALYTLYCSLFMPYMSYCVEVWGNTYISNLNPIVILQKKVIRVICKVHYRHSTNLLFHSMNILKFIDMVELSTGVLMYKVRNYMLPRRIQKLFIVNENISYNLRKKAYFKEPFRRTTRKSHCVSIIGPKVWHMYDINLKNCSTVHSFRRNLKLWLLRKYDVDIPS